MGKGKWNFSVLCRQKATGWSSPAFRVAFVVRADNEGEAEWEGKKGMAIGRQHLEYQKIVVEEIEKGGS